MTNDAVIVIIGIIFFVVWLAMDWLYEKSRH